MKRLLTLISVFALLLTACTGDQGPPGFDGRDGVNIVAQAFEIENVNFTPGNNFSVVEPFGPTFDVLPTDVALVYILWEDNVGTSQDVWRLLPQTVIFNDGNDLVYNFDFTQVDVNFFLEGSNLTILDPVWTQNQVFRVVVIPADNVGRLDVSNLSTVINTYNIESFEKRSL